MKIVIVGDTHFGAGYQFGKVDSITGLNTRLLDYEKTLSNIITYAIDNKIELFIFLGDIFETRNPPAHQIIVFYKQLKRLSHAGITTLMISGNHDQTKSRKITSSLDLLNELSLTNVHVFNNIAPFAFTDKNKESVNVIMFPYKNRHSYDKLTNEEALEEIKKEVNIAKSKLKKNTATIAVTHVMLQNTLPSDFGEYGTNELVVPFDIFNDIDAVITGHIHRASILNKSPVFIYSGSMECKDFSEREHKKCFIVYDTNKHGLDAISFMPITTRKFIDLDINYSAAVPDDPMLDIMTKIEKEDIQDAVVRINIKISEIKISKIDTTAIRNKLHESGINCIADITATPVILRQLRNEKVSQAPDDVSALKHYILSQTNVNDDVLEMGINIIENKIED